ncbi:MAG TPA: hypothetical protein VN112_08665 [Ensifer sp.]|nr:hypothetical protein [Ensifer sp.]
MTRLTLLLISTLVAGLIFLAPLRETGVPFQSAPVKVRSLSVAGSTPAPRRLPQSEVCESASTKACAISMPGSVGPRG